MIIGTAVKLKAQIAQPNSVAPYDPANGVTLTSLVVGLVDITDTLATTTFEREAAGDYVLIVPTVGFAPGRYTATVLIADTPPSQVVDSTTFVLTTS